MSTFDDLRGLGMPVPQANALGLPINAITTATTAQATGTALLPGLNVLTTAGSQTACVLPATLPLATPIFVHNSTATAGLVFPPSGGAIDGGSTDASSSLAQNKTAMFIRRSSTAWIRMLTD